ncbi:caspase family protein [Flectobacillus roseus]|jgi:hypothetical protein
MKKYILLFIIFLFTLETQAQGISINTVQLKDILWETPVTGADTLFRTNLTNIVFSCSTFCNAPLEKEDFSIWVNNSKVLPNNITVLNNKLNVTLSLDAAKDHLVAIKVMKGRNSISTSTIHIKRIPQLPEPKRYALLIANNDYQKVSSLKKVPIQDITFLQKSLIALGFKVDTCINQNREHMLNTLDTFVEKAAKADIVFYYYSGHGIQADGNNYLVPTDAYFRTVTDIPTRAVAVQSMISKLDEAQAASKIVVLDACRNSNVPIALANSRSEDVRGFTPIAGLKSFGGTYIVNSTQPNKVAYNDGLFAKYLASFLIKGKSVTDIFRTVRKTIRDASSGNQEPEINDKLEGEIIF